MILITLSSSESRSVSPLTPSPSREMKGIRLFRAISRKLARRSHEDINRHPDADSRSSSTDSCSSTSVGHSTRNKKEGNSSSGDSGCRSVSPNHMSSSSSDAGSDIQVRHRHHHSISAESIRKVFQNLSLNTRSHSCNNTKEVKRKTSKKAAPKRILRSPVVYTYAKGLSGLPTQRIPRCTSKVCNCTMQFHAGLRR